MKRLLIFHPTVAPYRIDFFNDLYKAFDTTVSLYYENLKDQKFKYDAISKKFVYKPDYFSKKLRIFGREVPICFITRLKEVKPDIVLVNEYGESFWFSALYRFISRKSYKIVSICDDSLDILENEKGLHSYARKIALNYLDGIVLCNDLVAIEYKKRVPEIKTYVMPIIQEETSFFEKKEELIKNAIEIASKEKLFDYRVFLYVGRISPEKNLIYLVKSFIRQHKDNPENILYIIGDCIAENECYNIEIDNLIEESGSCSYIRKIGRMEGEELKTRYYLGQVLMLPSVREPFGAVVNEALMAGNYVMVSSIAGSACLVNDSNGEVIDVNNEYIDFRKVNSRIPVLDEEYIVNKTNKMLFSYRECMDRLIDWINEL